jgi:hypothetical protein
MDHDTDIEIRIVLPRRQKRVDYFKNVEADLIGWFRQKHGSLPFFNSRIESKFRSKVRYSENHERQLRRLVGIGSGHRPKWALKPTRANEDFATYMRGEDLE